MCPGFLWGEILQGPVNEFVQCFIRDGACFGGLGLFIYGEVGGGLRRRKKTLDLLCSILL